MRPASAAASSSATATVPPSPCSAPRSPRIRTSPGSCWLEAPHTFVEEITLAGIREARARWLSGDLRARLARRHDDADALFEAWCGLWLDPRFRSWDVRHLLPRVRVPVLVIQGDADPYGSLAQVRAVAEGCAGPVETLVLAGCGHLPHLERPAEVLAAVAAFLRRLPPADGSASAPAPPVEGRRP